MFPSKKKKWYKMKLNNAEYGSKEILRYFNPTCGEDLKPLQRVNFKYDMK